jgi:hypothetical protein
MESIWYNRKLQLRCLGRKDLFDGVSGVNYMHCDEKRTALLGVSEPMMVGITNGLVKNR